MLYEQTDMRIEGQIIVSAKLRDYVFIHLFAVGL